MVVVVVVVVGTGGGHCLNEGLDLSISRKCDIVMGLGCEQDAAVPSSVVVLVVVIVIMRVVVVGVVL